jgi:serine/threonine-protein kinase
MSQREQATSEETLPWTADPTESPVKDLTGSVLGDFQVMRLLGRGGMGQVYLATQTSLDRPVALKVLHPRFLSKPAYLTRFEAEATAVAKLNHPNIVHVYTLGCVDQVRYIAMEYVEGTNLRDYIQKKGALDLPLALSIMRQAGQAIGVAGEIGLIHRDIKPENLLLTRRGRVKVADFGLCRDMGAERVNVTQTGITVGTPLYMSPEQAQGRALDHRSDLYSLGVTFYHMLTGLPPFRADSAVALALKHVNEIPLGLRVHRPEIPVELERLVLKLMAKNPADRYQSAAEMLADIGKIRGTLQDAGALGGEDTAALMTRGEETVQQTASGPGARPASSFALALPVGTSRPGAGRMILALTAGASLLAGAAFGWSSRPDVRPAAAGAARPMPGLSIEPGWSRIPRQDSAEQQYHFAQLAAPMDALTAAWLAVPGYHPRSQEWASPSYLQLARWLYRQRDLERLTRLAGDLAAWPAAKTPDRNLGEILESATKLLNKDLDGVAEGMAGVAGRGDSKRFEPGLLEFCIEIVSDAIHSASQPGAPALKRDLAETQVRLIRALRQVRASEWAGR